MCGIEQQRWFCWDSIQIVAEVDLQTGVRSLTCLQAGGECTRPVDFHQWGRQGPAALLMFGMERGGAEDVPWGSVRVSISG